MTQDNQTTPKVPITSKIKQLFVSIGILGVLGLMADFLGIISFFAPNDEQYMQIGNVTNFTTNVNNFNVLVLPLKPGETCKVHDADIEKHFSSFFANNDLFKEVKVKTSIQYGCPVNDTEALEIARKENATLVIWGKFDPNCSGDGVNKIRYSLNKPLGLLESGGNSISKNLLLSGYLPSNSKFIAEKTKALYLFSIGDPKAALNIRHYQNLN